MIDINKYTFKTESEKETAQFFDRLEIKCDALNWVTKIDGIDLGEIDGIFLDKENEVIFIYDESVYSNGVNPKINSFFTKWRALENQQLLRDGKGLPDYRIVILYIDKSKSSSEKNGLGPIKHLIGEDCFVLFNDEFDYFNNISKKVGKWVLNDLYNFLRIQPRRISRTISAIQYYIGDTPAYVYSDRVDLLLKYSFVSRKRDSSLNDSYQRMLDFSRIERIKNLLEAEKLNSFPNSILLNCIEPIKELPLPKSKCPGRVDITIPNHFSSCRVVDGQHRLLSFSKLKTEIQEKFSLPIVLFNNMSTEQEIKTFIEINDNQKRIDPNLTISLRSALNWDKDSKEYKQKIAYQVIEKLIRENNTFSKRIYRGFAGESKQIGKDNKLTVQQFVNSLIKNKIIDNKISSLQKDVDDKDTPSEIINNMYQRLLHSDGVNINYYYSNRGVNLILRFIGITSLNIKNNSLSVGLDDAMNDFSDVIKPLIPTLKSNYGAGGDAKSFEQLIEALKQSKKSYSNLETNFSRLRKTNKKL